MTISSIHDWRRKSPERLTRSSEDVKDELLNAIVLDIEGGMVLLETVAGERIWFGATAFDYDVEIRPWRG